MTPSPRFPFAAFLLCCLAAAPGPLASQSLGPSTGGAVLLDQSLRFLGHHKRVLVIGAHPDDEDTELLTVLTRGDGVETAYLSLTRGEGGQNLIGPELGEGLGLLRTGELVAARALDGGRQFFTRAYDFGYAKTIDDAWRHWPRDSVLKDVVRIVRRFRPQVVVTIFTGTPRDGHGQHQAAGWAAHEAFRVAGDPSVFPELQAEEEIHAWRPVKLYRALFRDRQDATLTLDGGLLDPAVGQSFHQIAMRSRSLHRSQDMGALQRIGPSSVPLGLVEDASGSRAAGLFDGIDTTLAALPELRGLPPAGRAEWEAIAAGLAAARASGGTTLGELRGRLLRAWPRAAGGQRLASPVLEDQLAHLDAALGVVRRVLCDGLADQAQLVPGDSVSLVLTCWNPSPDTLRVAMTARLGGTEVHRGGVRSLVPGAIVAESLTVLLPDTLTPTQPWFLHAPRDGAMYVWPSWARPWFGMPESPPPLEALFEVDGGPSLHRAVVYRSVDQGLGEVRTALTIVPRVSVSLSPTLGVWPMGHQGTRSYTVTLRMAGRTPVDGRIVLELPVGWPAVPPVPFRFESPGQTMVATFPVRVPVGMQAGSYDVRAFAVERGRTRHGTGSVTVAYPHVAPVARVVEAAATVRLDHFALPAVRRVGYVVGAADAVPEVLRSVGVPVEMVGADVLARGDLGVYEVLVVGPRAFETEPALAAHHDRILAYARAGGRVVVQYQQHDYFRRGFAPYPMDVAQRHDRVTDETAPVTLLRPADPTLSTPNPLGSEDWEGWVQERGLYFPRTWDAAWRPILRMGDPGEDPLDGGLLVARTGRGTYVYTGLAFFRQLPAGVPGAIRLFLNLLTPTVNAPLP